MDHAYCVWAPNKKINKNAERDIFGLVFSFFLTYLSWHYWGFPPAPLFAYLSMQFQVRKKVDAEYIQRLTAHLEKEIVWKASCLLGFWPHPWSRNTGNLTVLQYEDVAINILLEGRESLCEKTSCSRRGREFWIEPFVFWLVQLFGKPVVSAQHEVSQDGSLGSLTCIPLLILSARPIFLLLV